LNDAIDILGLKIQRKKIVEAAYIALTCG